MDSTLIKKSTDAMHRDSTLCYILLLIISIFLSVACQSDHDVASNQQDALDKADQISYNAKLISTVRGKLSSVIIYKRMERYSKKKYVYFYDGVDISLYEEGNFVSKIKSDSAELDERSETMIFNGNVSVKSEDGISLTTSKLKWQEDEARVTSDAFVTVVTAENDTINGAGFESEKSFKKWLIHKPYGVTQTTLDLGVSKQQK